MVGTLKTSIIWRVKYQDTFVDFNSKRKAFDFCETLMESNRDYQLCTIVKFPDDPEAELFDRETGEIIPGTAEALDSLSIRGDQP